MKEYLSMAAAIVMNVIAAAVSETPFGYLVAGFVAVMLIAKIKNGGVHNG